MNKAYHDYTEEDVITLELSEDDFSDMVQTFMNQPGRINGQVSVAMGTRTSQQDSSYLSIDDEQKSAIAIICDGMGGLTGGEKASQKAVMCFAQDFDQFRPGPDNMTEFFQRTVTKADRDVAALTDEDGVLLDCGTTLVAAVIDHGYLNWVSVGDSKIYVIRGNDMVCVVKEHTYLNLLNDQLLSGEITEEVYAKEQVRGAALTSYVGMGNVSLIEMNYQPFALQDGDMVLLCSDGLYKALPEERILEIIKNYPSEIRTILDTLQSEAKDHCIRSQDNTSIILLEYKKNM